MKICLINNLFKPFDRGGAERVVELIADALAEKGHEVFVISTKPFGKRKSTSGKYTNYYITSFYYNLNKIPKIIRLAWHFIDIFDICSYLKIRSILKKEKPLVVMTHNLKGIGFLTPQAIRKSKIKHIHTLHDIQLLHPSGLMIYGQERQISCVFSRIYQYLVKKLFKSPDSIISPSKWLMNMHQEKGFFTKSQKLIWPNPIGSCLKATNTRDKIKCRPFSFLYVGQIEEHKGVLLLIKTFTKLLTRLDDIVSTLTIVGDGSEINKARKLVQANQQIHFTGRLKKSGVMEVMINSNCLVVPSLCYENSPTVIFEALSKNLNVIAADIGGIPELLDNKLLFQPNDEESLSKKIKWVITNQDELVNITHVAKTKILNFTAGYYARRLISLLK